jgi:transposase
MRFYTQKHKHYCGIDLHAKSMYICISNQDGEILLHKDINTDKEIFLRTINPYKEDLVIAVECIFCWYWLADFCSTQNITFVLAHALYMKAIHGGKAKNDKIDSAKINTLLRGGMLPVSYVYPPLMRATRDLMRRRNHFVRKRGELTAHIQMTLQQYNLPAVKRMDRNSNLPTIEINFSDPSIQKNIDTDLALIEHYNKAIPELEWYILKTARHHDSKTCQLLQTIPGVGDVLSLIIFYEIHDINRFPRVQDFLSYSRLVKCAKESAGKRSGTGGSKIGNVHLKWAFSEAAILFIRGDNERRNLYNKIINKHGKGKALSIIAAKLGRAVYFMLKREKIFDERKFLNLK